MSHINGSYFCGARDRCKALKAEPEFLSTATGSRAKLPTGDDMPGTGPFRLGRFEASMPDFWCWGCYRRNQ